MNIRELYITDVNKNGDFWSKDKIDKLNDMFSQLQNGLQSGVDGNTGPGGAGGGDGGVGSQGPVGATGLVGLTGTTAQSIWTRTTHSNGKETLSLASDNSSVILGGTSTLTNALTCDDGTVISATNNQKVPILGASKPSALRIHAINDTGGTQRHHIRLKSYLAGVTTSYIDLNASNETVTFDSDKITISSTNILIYDGTSAVSAFTDAGIVISSGLTFKVNTTQSFAGDIVLSNGLWTAHSSSGLWGNLINTAHDYIQHITQVVYGNNLYRVISPTALGHIAWSAVGPVSTTIGNYDIVDGLHLEYIGPCSIDTLYLASNPTETLTGKQVICDTTLPEGNLTFGDISSNYVSFPPGSIIQLNNETITEYFNTDFAIQSFPVTTNGNEVYVGRGSGPWDGWYLCNGQEWRTPQSNSQFTSGYVKTLSDMNTLNHNIDADTVPSSYDSLVRYNTGGKRMFSVSAGGDMTMAKTQMGLYHPNNDIFFADGGAHGLTGPMLPSLSKELYVVFLNVLGLVWYTDPPPPNTSL